MIEVKRTYMAVLSENLYKHQKNIPRLLHTKKDFPVIQPAIIEGIFVDLTEQLN